MNGHGSRIPIELQQVFLAAARGEEVTDAPKSAFRSFPLRPKWLNYPRMYRRSNKKANRREPRRDSTANAAKSMPAAVVGSSLNTILNQSVHHPTTPKTSQSSPSVPSSTKVSNSSHCLEEFHLHLPQYDAILTGVPQELHAEEWEDTPFTTPKASRSRPLKAIRKAFTRKKREDGFQLEGEEIQRRRTSMGSWATEKSQKSNGSRRSQDPSRKGPMQRMFLKKSSSHHHLVNEASETEQV